MARPMYVPVLGVRRNTMAAFGELPVRVRSRIMPLWTVVPRVGERARGVWPERDPDPDPVALDNWLAPKVDHLIDVMDGRPGWIDAGHVEAQTEASAAAVWHVAMRSRLRLVTELERPARLQRYAADLAFLSGQGLGIRVLLDDAPGERRAEELHALIRRLCLPAARLDLILDLGPVADAQAASKTALAAVDLLSSLLPWRAVILAAGGFPQWLEDLDHNPRQYVPRLDWHVYEAVRTARLTSTRNLLYGDYGVEQALAANRPRVEKPGPPWGLMRYTTPETFLVARAPTRGTDRATEVRAVAQGLVDDAAFRGTEYSEGERWLYDCAHGQGRNGSGNPEIWTRTGHVQHMTWVVDQLSGWRPPSGA
ncbi:beta family protein [Streptomyces endophyticus]|uniref:Beta family protein n=1 Tax=Streptomyces endophyticus TaxID=714166 RepID=A0ABU6F6I0_9ACTN|nr:hypothetical protein [Streptomyces endophyticus]MEB8339439.1 beta family protein [Streptomyces endophyticus]